MTKVRNGEFLHAAVMTSTPLFIATSNMKIRKDLVFRMHTISVKDSVCLVWGREHRGGSRRHLESGRDDNPADDHHARLAVKSWGRDHIHLIISGNVTILRVRKEGLNSTAEVTN